MDNRLALPKSFFPPGSQQALNMTKSSNMRSLSPREQQSPETDYQTNEKQLTVSKVSPYAQKEKRLDQILYATISQTPSRRVEPPFGILDLPQFESNKTARRNMIRVQDSVNKHHQSYDDEQ